MNPHLSKLPSVEVDVHKLSISGDRATQIVAEMIMEFYVGNGITKEYAIEALSRIYFNNVQIMVILSWLDERKGSTVHGTRETSNSHD